MAAITVLLDKGSLADFWPEGFNDAPFQNFRSVIQLGEGLQHLLVSPADAHQGL
ncbi:MAG TPA: hypothetical protein VMB23_05120 [Spirochaetia bacterium]|jgi:hypothetical protein|nr:hypothetical protein [Spirochaetia bacterium]